MLHVNIVSSTELCCMDKQALLTAVDFRLVSSPQAAGRHCSLAVYNTQQQYKVLDKGSMFTTTSSSYAAETRASVKV